MTNPELDALLVELDAQSGWQQIIEKHREVTDDKKITYVLKDGTRIHEDESVVAALAASLSKALEKSSDVSAQAIAAIRALREENERMREGLGDLVSWFTEPSIDKRVWLIPAGERGADDAVVNARAALGGDG